MVKLEMILFYWLVLVCLGFQKRNERTNKKKILFEHTGPVMFLDSVPRLLFAFFGTKTKILNKWTKFDWSIIGIIIITLFIALNCIWQNFAFKFSVLPFLFWICFDFSPPLLTNGLTSEKNPIIWTHFRPFSSIRIMDYLFVLALFIRIQVKLLLLFSVPNELE